MKALQFDWRAALVRAEEALSAPPAIERIQRPVLRGTLVKRFILPLELCKPLNQLSRAGTASRPQIVCVRFSSVEPDHESGWCKNPVDRLRVGKNGLGIIVDDKPRNIELLTRWEPAPPRHGAVLVEVWS